MIRDTTSSNIVQSIYLKDGEKEYELSDDDMHETCVFLLKKNPDDTSFYVMNVFSTYVGATYGHITTILLLKNVGILYFNTGDTSFDDSITRILHKVVVTMNNEGNQLTFDNFSNTCYKQIGGFCQTYVSFLVFLYIKNIIRAESNGEDLKGVIGRIKGCFQKIDKVHLFLYVMIFLKKLHSVFDEKTAAGDQQLAGREEDKDFLYDSEKHILESINSVVEPEF